MKTTASISQGTWIQSTLENKFCHNCIYTALVRCIQVPMAQAWLFLVATILSLNTYFTQLIKYAELLYTVGFLVPSEKYYIV